VRSLAFSRSSRKAAPRLPSFRAFFSFARGAVACFYVAVVGWQLLATRTATIASATITESRVDELNFRHSSRLETAKHTRVTCCAHMQDEEEK